VSGSAAADSTIEYSVTVIGSRVVRTSPAPSTIETRVTRWNRGASAGRTNLPHWKPKYWAMV
jgi:hypothetical protein